jgi:uncharacterized protein YkwD
VVGGLVTGFVLAAPVVSGSGSPADPQAESDLVVMGLDGRPSSAGATAGPAPDADGTARVEEPAGGAAPVPAPAPAPVAAPAPSAAVPVPTTPKGAAPARPAPTTSAAPRKVLPAAPAPPPPAAVPAGSDRAAQVLALVNEARASAGCRPLAADARLAAVAAAHSADMRDRGFFDHVNLAGLTPFDRAEAAGVSARAENIARGQRDAAAVMTSWMNSPGHRANILDCGLTRLGVGIADGGGGPWWTQLFA